MKKLHLVACILAVAIAIPAVAGELQGVTVADKTSVDGKDLVLNGMGLRTKAFAKVYVTGLYAEAKSTDAAKIVATDAAGRGPTAVEAHSVRPIPRAHARVSS